MTKYKAIVDFESVIMEVEGNSVKDARKKALSETSSMTRPSYCADIIKICQECGDEIPNSKNTLCKECIKARTKGEKK